MRRGSGYVWLAFMAGAAAGALAAYFLGTESGRKMWAEWKEKASKAKDSLLQELEAFERMMQESENTENNTPHNT